MHRIYSNYTDEEFKTIEEEANKAGMIISAFCKVAVIAKVSGKTDNSSTDLIKILHKKLKSLDEGEVFIVSDLYSEEVWASLSRSFCQLSTCLGWIYKWFDGSGRSTVPRIVSL